MTDTSERIPFAIEISRMIEVLAAQIYPTPFALLRENVQNSFDAILQRQYLGHEFAARIDVDIEPRQVRVTDNGIGMSREDLRKPFLACRLQQQEHQGRPRGRSCWNLRDRGHGKLWNCRGVAC